MHLTAKKSLGQHFLVVPAFHKRIVEALAPTSDDVVIEIGPGTGLLTRVLLESPLKQLIAFELDARAVPELQAMFRSEGKRFELQEQDFLEMDLKAIAERVGQTLKVAGNIPYHITSPILFKLIDERKFVKQAVLLVQKEVAERLVARPRTKEYGIPTVFANFFGEVSYLFTVPAGAFRPVPKVDSAVVRIAFDRDYFTRTGTPPPPSYDEAAFRKLVRSLFAMRRKTIRNNLKAMLSAEAMKPVEGGPALHFLTQRAEELAIPDFLEILRAIDLRANGFISGDGSR